MQGAGSVDFFISYTGRDWSWASWLDYQLRQHGYTTILQGYDFATGKSFVEAMDEALKHCRFVACLLSPAYLESGWCKKELAAGLYADKLALLRIADCQLDGLYGPYAYADLFDLDEVAARDLALAQLHKRAGKDPRPKVSPQFPGKPNGERAPRYPAHQPEVWNIRQQRNRYFTGRDDLLKALHQSLSEGNNTALTQAVTGLGGVGKTQLALEYCYRHASDYDGIWWLRAEEPVTLAGDYAALAEPLGIKLAQDQGEMVRQVYESLRHRERFLLVFDNATDAASLEPYLPTHAARRIVVTTRAQVWPNAAPLKVETLELDVAVEFLLNRTDKTDKTAAAEIAQRLGCLPLALEQAAAYIEACDKSLRDYSKLLEQHGLKVLDAHHAHQYEKTVGTTWLMAFDRLRKTCPVAVDIMHLCAFLAPEAIYLSELAAAKEHLPQRLAETIADELVLDQARAALRQYSLINSDSDAISIHRLVQEVTREGMRSHTLAEWKRVALMTVNSIFPEEPADTKMWPVCARWLAHAIIVASEAGRVELQPRERSSLYNRIGIYLKSRAEYSQAELNYRRSVHAAESSAGQDDIDVAEPLNNLAVLLKITNRLDESEQLMRRVLHIDETHFGPGELAVARDLNNLAVIMKDTNRHNDAEPLYRRAISIWEAKLGPEHQNVATGLNNLASLLRMTNRLPEAEPLCRRALWIWESNFGAQHPLVASGASTLALLLADTNRQVEAEALLRRALEIDAANFGPDHPNTALRLNNLAHLLRRTNRLADAEPLLRRALEIWESKFGTRAFTGSGGAR